LFVGGLGRDQVGLCSRRVDEWALEVPWRVLAWFADVNRRRQRAFALGRGAALGLVKGGLDNSRDREIERTRPARLSTACWSSPELWRRVHIFSRQSGRDVVAINRGVVGAFTVVERNKGTTQRNAASMNAKQPRIKRCKRGTDQGESGPGRGFWCLRVGPFTFPHFSSPYIYSTLMGQNFA